jgi:hypothetical protein
MLVTVKDSVPALSSRPMRHSRCWNSFTFQPGGCQFTAKTKLPLSSLSQASSPLLSAATHSDQLPAALLYCARPTMVKGSGLPLRLTMPEAPSCSGL